MFFNTKGRIEKLEGQIRSVQRDLEYEQRYRREDKAELVKEIDQLKRQNRRLQGGLIHLGDFESGDKVEVHVDGKLVAKGVFVGHDGSLFQVVVCTKEGPKIQNFCFYSVGEEINLRLVGEG